MARRLRVTMKWLRAEAEEGRIPHLRAGRILLFDPETVERLLLKRAQEIAPQDSGPPTTDGPENQSASETNAGKPGVRQDDTHQRLQQQADPSNS